MRLSPPCNANRNRKGPNSKVLIQAQAPWPQAEAWGLSPARGTGGPGPGHGGVWRALRDEGAESCEDGPAAADAGICTSGCCIPGPAPQLCRPGSRRHTWRLTHQVSPEQPWPGRGFRRSGTSAPHVPVVPQAGSREVGVTGGQSRSSTSGRWSQGATGVTARPSLQMTPRQRAAAGMAPPP